MNTSQTTNQPLSSPSSNIVIKGLMTGGLILLMLIPTVFILNLVSERENRQKEVVHEVSKKWAAAQTVTGPYILIPYVTTELGVDKKPIEIRKTITLLPEVLSLNGSIFPEKRLRSIYTVLLYKSQLNATGTFKIELPADINANNLIYSEAKICLGLSDYKGIEEQVSIQFNGTFQNMIPGLPEKAIDTLGLSAVGNIKAGDIGKPLDFSFNLKLKGSEKLYFVPLCANGTFNLKSSWANPSFDGNTLPTERIVNEAGFSATWKFNKANLPFTTVLQNAEIRRSDYAFGLSMLQPADHYSKTERSVKYAILFIGLTFSLFFVIELLQKKPVHPVQYVLVGLALIIFYCLLLAFSEYIHFNAAYFVASLATILLITFYAYGHFKSWKVAGVFATALGCLYGFIFVLIQLEDTALLVGSIGLFVILAITMYVSRKINWYGTVPRPVL